VIFCCYYCGPDEEGIMNETLSPRRLGRSIWAVLAGFILVFVLSIGTDLLLHLIGLYPDLGKAMSDRLLALATIYRTLYGVLGSYLTARLAPQRPMQHALIGGAIGVALSIVGAVVTWNHVPSMGPHWYPVVLIVLAMPGAWLGGKLFLIRSVGKAT
jgi:hypothetical protein